ncbi:MAG: bifunctional nuclease family protein [Armatimonadota bacterium]|nr:bifunctional nuclease family protein [bacterium]
MAENFGFEDEERPGDLFPDSLGDEDEAVSDESSREEHEVKVMGVYEHKEQENVQPTTFFVLLRDSKSRSVLIWIGKFEAMAISLALDGASADRPITHDLLNNVINRMGGTVERILIDDLWNNTYYAKVTIAYNGKVVDVDSRPSDAIALGLRAKAPIFMVEGVLERAAVREE